MGLSKILGVLALIAFGAQPSFALQTKKMMKKDNHVKMIVSPKVATSGSATDLLFIIDDSGSMAEYQKLLASGAVALASELKSRPSLHVAITTTSMCATAIGAPCANGKFVAPGVITSDMPDFVAQFQKSVLVGTIGDGVEQMFTPVIAALTPPLSDNENRGFLRLDAHLAVVILTDADDQSTMKPADLISGLEAIKGKGNFSVHGIISSVAAACPNEGMLPVKIQDAITLSGGTVHSICTGNYADVLTKIGSGVAASVERTIRLPFAPVAGSVSVKYGAITLMPGDLHKGWTYDSAINAIILGDAIDWASMPSADLEIEFNY